MSPDFADAISNVPETDVAEFLGVSTRTIREMAQKGDLLRCGPARYDLRQFSKAWGGISERAAGRSGEDGDLDLVSERARLAKEQADAQAMKNEQSRMEVLPRAEVHIAVTSALMRVRAKLLAIPTKVAPLVFGLGMAEIREKIQQCIYEALSELAGTIIAGVPVPDEPEQGGSVSSAGVVGDPGATSEPDGKPVGRPRKKAQQRGKRGAGDMGHEPG